MWVIIALIGGYIWVNGRGIDCPIGFGIMGFGILFCDDENCKIVGLLCLLIAFVWGFIYRENERNGTNAKNRLAELRQIEKEKEAAEASHYASEPWAIRYATEPCPNCGHYKVRNAKWEDKRLSVAFWGAASSKIGTNFKCEHCGKMW